MFDFTSIYGTHAKAIVEPMKINEIITYTYTKNSDEVHLYKDLSDQLAKLEKSLIIDREALKNIENDVKGFRLAIDDKDEIVMRIGWLERLHTVQQEIDTVQTREQGRKLIELMAVCQTSLLKTQLTTQLELVIQSLPDEKLVTMTDAEVLLEKVFEEAGASFANLGRAGREKVISDVIKQFGKNAPVEAIKKHTKALEREVEALASIEVLNELIKQLNSLPLPAFYALTAERKHRIAEMLLENNKWNGLASLNRIIAHMDKAITNEEQKQEEAINPLLTSDGKSASTLDIKSVENGRVQL